MCRNAVSSDIFMHVHHGKKTHVDIIISHTIAINGYRSFRAFTRYIMPLVSCTHRRTYKKIPYPGQATLNHLGSTLAIRLRISEHFPTSRRAGTLSRMVRVHNQLLVKCNNDGQLRFHIAHNDHSNVLALMKKLNALPSLDRINHLNLYHCQYQPMP